jgi:hypothetical protein
MSSPSLEPIQARLSLQTPAWRQTGQNSEIWTDSPLLLLPLFSLGCGVLVCSLTLSQQQPRSWLALLLSDTQPPKWLGFSPLYLSRRHLSRWIRTSINGWYVLDFLGWCWAANTPPCGGTWPNTTIQGPRPNWITSRVMTNAKQLRRNDLLRTVLRSNELFSLMLTSYSPWCLDFIWLRFHFVASALIGKVDFTVRHISRHCLPPIEPYIFVCPASKSCYYTLTIYKGAYEKFLYAIFYGEVFWL